MYIMDKDLLAFFLIVKIIMNFRKRVMRLFRTDMPEAISQFFFLSLIYDFMIEGKFAIVAHSARILVRS